MKTGHIGPVHPTDSLFSFSSQHPRRGLPRHPDDHLALLYRGPCCIIAAFCSWNRSFNRAEPLRFLSTHRRMHCSSRLTRDLVVKSLTQSSKQRWTILEYICVGVRHRRSGEVRNQTIHAFHTVITYSHKLLHLLALHARRELALLRLVEAVGELASSPMGIGETGVIQREE